MSWPTDQVVVGDLITAAQLNRLLTTLADTSLGADAATIDFTSIPAHWTHLMLVLYGRGTQATADSTVRGYFNNDSGANYDYEIADEGVGSESFATAGWRLGNIAAASAAANLFDMSIAFIANYANASNNKTIISLGGTKRGTSAGDLNAWNTACWWRSNAAINRITLFPGAGSFKAGTRATLYGMGRI